MCDTQYVAKLYDPKVGDSCYEVKSIELTREDAKVEAQKLAIASGARHLVTSTTDYCGRFSYVGWYTSDGAWHRGVPHDPTICDG